MPYLNVQINLTKGIEDRVSKQVEEQETDLDTADTHEVNQETDLDAVDTQENVHKQSLEGRALTTIQAQTTTQKAQDISQQILNG